ncbi:MAG: PIN domain-containing protein [Solirubrobacterales bacterium]|nr:PIN domain-containing protein [Solirubrobacterales bacterium]
MSEPELPQAGCLVDNSAWSRSDREAIAGWWPGAFAAGRLICCDAFLLEALYSARSGTHMRALHAVITGGMPSVQCSERTWEIAFEAQQAMADAAGLMHRRKPMDFLMAATAHQHGLGILHYDRDYDLIAEHGGLDFASVWVAPPGSLDT